MSSKVKIDTFKRDMQRAIEEISKASELKVIGDFAAERIRLRTRLGRGVAQNDGESQPLKKLSDSYKDQRKGKIAFFTKGTGPDRVVVPYKPNSPPILDARTSAGKSNLTRTGQMLDSIKPTRVKSGESITVGPSGKRVGKNEKLTNQQVAEYVSKERPFLNLSRAEIKGITRFISERLEIILKRLGLTTK